MKKILPAIIALLVSSASVFAFPSFDPFADASGSGGTTYPAGVALFGHTNAFGEGWAKWTEGTATNTVFIVNSNITYNNFPAGFPAPTGNSVQVPVGNATTNGVGAALTFSTPIGPDPALKSTNRIYMSFLMQVPNNVGLGGGVYWAGLVESSQAGAQTFALPPSHAFKFFIETNATTGGYSIGPADNGGTLNAGYDAGGHNAGDILFVVLDYEFGTNSNGANDTTHMWVNPVAGSFGTPVAPAPTTSHAIAMGNNLTNAAAFYLLGRAATTMPVNGIIFDELRVGHTWSYVTGGPDIITGPINSTNTPGTTATFIARAFHDTSNDLLTYQWQLNGVNLTDNSQVSGSTTTNLVISNVAAANAGTYTFIATSALGSASASAVLSVDPTILTQPVNQQSPVGGNATFSVTATTVAPPLSYQWQENGVNVANGTSSSGTVFTGSQTSTLSLSQIGAADGNATFTVIVKNNNGNISASSGATLAIVDPGLITLIQNVKTNYGGTDSFLITVGGTGPFTYQWSQNGNALSDGSSPTGDGAVVSGSQGNNLVITGVTYQEAGTYTVVATGADGSTNATATLTVADPYIVTQPSPLTQTVTNGSNQTAIFTVTANGTPTLNYQWRLNGAALTDGDNISGSQTPTLTVVNPTDANGGNYSVNVTGGSGSNIISSNAVLTVLDPVILTSALQSRLERVGDNLSFVIGVDATGATFRWFNGTTLIPTATSSNLTFTNIQLSNAGTYTVVVSNVFNAITNIATLAVTNQYLALATNNLEVSRVGDGVQPLNDTNGNTLYLDQFSASGSYVSTIMISNSGPSALIVEGGNPDGLIESVLTLSTNQFYLDFGGYNLGLPNSNTSFLGGGGGATNGLARAIGAVNALGYYTLCLTNTGLYSAGVQLRSVVSTDGLTNFWTAGSGGGGIKYLTSTTGPVGIIEPLAVTDPRVVQIYNGNLYFTSGSGTNGLFSFGDLPTANSTGASPVIFPTGTSPVDFAISPDGNTIYIADDSSVANGGGIQRWDGGGLTYTFGTGDGSTVGARGLTVDFSNFANGTGAVVYATTAENSGNRLIAINDTGAGSPVTVLSTAGVNQLYRGVRFGPAVQPFLFASQPQSKTVFVGDNAVFSAQVSGDNPFAYQWQFNGNNISGATSNVLVLTNVQAASAGNYTLTVSNLATNITSAVATLTVSPFSPGVNLAAYYAFDDGSGLTALDSSGNGNNGALLNFPGDNSEWVTGRIGGALDFANANGTSNNAVEVPDSSTLNFGTNLTFSLAAWVKAAPTQLGGAGIISKGIGNGGEEYNLDVFNTTGFTNVYRFFVRSASGVVSTILTQVHPDNRWQYIAATFDGNVGKLNFFLNGQLMYSSNAPNSLLNNTTPLSIGNRKANASATDYNLPFVGEIDDVRIYNSALGTTDVQDLYATAPAFAPVFYIEPQGTNVSAGATVTFSAQVDGSDPLTYQWFKNSAAISGATNATLTLANVQASDTANYTLQVSNSVSTATSTPAALQVASLPVASAARTSNGTIQLTEFGPANASYRVFATTNIALPFSQWIPIATNSFDNTGTSTFMDPNSTNLTTQFYRISVP